MPPAILPMTLDSLNDEFAGKARLTPSQHPKRDQTNPNELSRVYENANLEGQFGPIVM